MKTYTGFDISPLIPYLAKFWFLSYEPKCCQPVKLQDSWKCNISRKEWMMKFIYGMQIKMEVLYKLILSFWVCGTRHTQSTQCKTFACLCSISKKHGGWSCFFCLQINTRVFYKMIVSLWVYVARHVQSTQNSKFPLSLQYLKENAKDKVNFLPKGKRQRFLRIDTIILRLCGQVCPNYPK